MCLQPALARLSQKMRCLRCWTATVTGDLPHGSELCPWQNICLMLFLLASLLCLFCPWKTCRRTSIMMQTLQLSSLTLSGEGDRHSASDAERASPLDSCLDNGTD